MRFEVTFTVGQHGLGKLLGMLPPRTAQRAQIKPIPGMLGEDDDLDELDSAPAPAPGYGKPGMPAKPTDIVMRGDSNDWGTGDNARIVVEHLEHLEAEHGVGSVTRRMLHESVTKQGGLVTKSATGTISKLLEWDVLRCMGPGRR